MFDLLRNILARHDPIGIIIEDVNPDEYDPEVGTILPRLGGAQSEREVQRIIHEEFVRWFDDGIAGPETKYARVANDIWRLLRGPNGGLLRGPSPKDP
jgi:hypothetical protein